LKPALLRIKLMRVIYIGCAVLIVAMLSWAQPPSPGIYRLDAGNSSLQIEVFRGGLFGFLGHDHTIMCKRFSGYVQIDPAGLEHSTVSINIDTTSLTVLDPEVSEKERSEVQATMESSKVLDVGAFPAITFRSTQVRYTAEEGKYIEIELTGILSLHGVDKEITLPARIRFEEDSLRAKGMISIKQTDFGISPIRLVGGTVRVKDKVTLSFDIQAKRAD
jgi:polyisoprenoid-binding protein YceI